jgi:hypothetical protein
MMRIAWQPRTRAAKLLELLSQRLQSWREAWLPPSHEPLRMVLETRPPAGADTLSLEGTQGRTWFHASRTFASRLGEACLSLDAHLAPDLAGEMGAQAARALQMILHAGNAPIDVPASTSKPGDEGLLRHGALYFLIEGLPEPLRLTVDGAWCRAHAGAESMQMRCSLLPRQQALRGTTVQVTGQMALGEVSLLDSLSWSVGDVLVTDTPRDSRARLMVGTTAFATARLVPQANHPTLILD